LSNIVSDQLELFVTQLLDIPSKNDQSLLEYPFFGLTKQQDTRKRDFLFNNGEIKITILPSADGIATIWDKDILIYCFNLVRQEIDEGKEPSRFVRFPVYNYLNCTNRGTGNSQYKSFVSGVRRLKSTTIRTNIRTQSLEQEMGYSWINSYNVIKKFSRNGEELACAVEVELSDWVYRAALNREHALSISPEYFELSMGLERRIYELARKHCGNQKDWVIYLPNLLEKAGSQDELKSFAQQIRKIISRNQIPDYALELISPDNAPRGAKLERSKVRFFPKDLQKAQKRALKPIQGEMALEAALPLPNQKRPSERAKKRAKEEFPLYDINYLEQEWLDWSSAKGQKVTSPDGAFLAFVRENAKRNPIR